jgi:multiple sugar transport system substrate-binding protein
MLLSRCLSRPTSMSTSMDSAGRAWLRRAVGSLLAISPVLLLAACGSSSNSSSSTAQAAAKASAGRQTIVWAVQGGVSGGVGSEGLASRDVIANFERAYPNIKVQVLALSSDADTALQTVNQHFIAGDSAPDLIDSDPTWVAPFANAGFIAPLQPLGISTSWFLPGEVSQGSFHGKLYGVFWYDGAEGLYYRTDLVKSPPKTPMQLVADAQAAMKADPKLKEGIAFEGMKYEGAVTVFNDLMAAFGGKYDPANLDTPQNVAALQFLHDLVYKYKVASTAVTSWDEGGADKAFQAGQAAFETNWPFALQEINTKGALLYKKANFAPFPTVSGVGTATQGGNELVVNAKTKHLAAVETFVKYILSPSQQRLRAVVSGDPPAVTSAYTTALFSKAPYFQTDLNVFKVGNPRPVLPRYKEISTYIQDMISAVLANQESPAAALKSTAAKIQSLASA